MKKGYTYLGNKNWINITRDERRFCADLVHQIESKNKLSQFVKWLVKTTNLPVNNFNNPSIDFEVCFYRDLLFARELKNNFRFKDKAAIRGILKRTFDICIFLPEDIIIIEAKAANSFTSKQMNEFDLDRKLIQSLKFEDPPKLHVLALISHQYTPKNKKQFDGIITWLDINNASQIDYDIPDSLINVYANTKKVIGNKNVRDEMKIIQGLKRVIQQSK